MRKKILFVLFLYSLLFPLSTLFAQRDSLPSIGLDIISKINQGNSYITFPTDVGNLEPLWFEANLIPNFILRTSESSRLMSVLTPQIIIRMFQETSFPVRTPSYRPTLTIYYNLKDRLNSNKTVLFWRFGHHSNGQDNGFYLENGDFNLKSGDFATNYLELGLIQTNRIIRHNVIHFYKTSFEVHPQGLNAEELEGIYPKYRFNMAFTTFKLPSQKNSLKFKNRARASLKVNSSLLIGKINDWSATSINRIVFDFTLYYHPTFLEDVGLFAKFYHGFDYYNMYFNHQLNVLRFGIMTDKLNF